MKIRIPKSEKKGAAIVAREIGIPCVVAVENASTILKNGQTVLVDGNEGFVKYC